MKVLYLVSPKAHSHDYAVDLLYFGLCTVLGPDNVLPWPENDSLHLTPNRQPCDVCRGNGYDSDQEWPRRGHSLSDALRECDVAIIATQGGDMLMRESANILRDGWAADKPIVGYDTSDNVLNDRGDSALGYFRFIAGRPLSLMFKREIPIGDQWALPLPLSYPAAWAPKGMVQKEVGVFYHATRHSPDGPGKARQQLIEAIHCALWPMPNDAKLYDPGDVKLTKEQYRANMRKFLVGFSWNGFPYIPNWDNNRVWEQFAYGMCQIVERPRIRIPHAPIHGLHCYYIDAIDQVPEVLVSIYRNPDAALKVADAGHQHFLRYHSSERRAEYVIRMIEELC